jgi:hypothetical protein
MLNLNLVGHTARELHELTSVVEDTPDMTEFQKQSLISGLEIILEEAKRVASAQRELSMPLGAFEIIGFLRYTRQPSGHRVLPFHALNAVTREFFDQLYAMHYGLTQFYVGEEQAIFSPAGPQRLRLHW